MAKNYSITFKSLRAAAGDSPYVLTIGGGNGAAVPLNGGASPFMTQESDDENMFVPIRTQTGYLSIVDNGKDANGNAFDWKDLIPETDTSRPVTLTQGGTTLWQGFMQAQDFGSVLYGNPQQRDFPVQCVLSVLGGTDINYTQTSIQNFAYLLKQIVDAIPSAQRPTDFYIQGGSEAQTWLLKRIDWQNFVSMDDDGFTARYTMYQCLEDMCRFWGWTARTKGTTMYLTCADDNNQTTWLKLTYAQLGQLAAYTSGTIPGTTSDTFQTVALTGDIFASTNNDEYVQRGYKKATIQSDGNVYGDNLYQSFPNDVIKQMENGGWSGYTRYGDVSVNYTNDILTFGDDFMSVSAVSGKGSFNLAMYDKNNQPADKKRVVRILKSYNGSPYISLESRYEHMFYGFMQFKCNIYQRGVQYQENRGVYNKTMRVAIGIGSDRNHAQWYNGANGWGSTKTIFKCLLGYEDGILRFFSGALTWDVISMGYYLLAGKLFIDFYGSEDLTAYDGQRLFDIDGLSIEYKLAEYDFDYSVIERKNTVEYKSANSNNSNNEWEADCIFASENNYDFGFGVLINPDNTPLTTMTFAGSATAKHPEQHLADRVTTFWQTSRRRLAVELRRDLIADITPRHKVTIDGMTAYPIAISHEWRDDVLQLTILQL